MGKRSRREARQRRKKSRGFVDDCPICALMTAMEASGEAHRIDLPFDGDDLGLDVVVSAFGAPRSTARS
ncbi:MAG: hypothetical protein IT379_16945 [Deltaproteobacteria bacterium]|nr:hypothetical protein [Deltaproteobacteria bacterium]